MAPASQNGPPYQGVATGHWKWASYLNKPPPANKHNQMTGPAAQGEQRLAREDMALGTAPTKQNILSRMPGPEEHGCSTFPATGLPCTPLEVVQTRVAGAKACA